MNSTTVSADSVLKIRIRILHLAIYMLITKKILLFSYLIQTFNASYNSDKK